MMANEDMNCAVAKQVSPKNRTADDLLWNYEDVAGIELGAEYVLSKPLPGYALPPIRWRES